MTTETNTVAMINNTLRKISKADNVRQDTALMMKPYSNWEEFLMPAPIAVSILGELIFISAKDDFPIDQNMPKDGYQYIRYPQSFRACLVQVSNQGWEAFNEAHKNMDGIRLHSLTIPNHIKNSVRILMQGNKDMIHTLLPKVLRNVSSSAESCLSLATSVETKFNAVMVLVNELLEACTNSRGAHEQSLEEVKMKMKEYKVKEESAKAMKEMTLNQEKLMKKQMEQCQEDYKSALNSMPSGWEVLGMNFVDGLLNTVNTITSTLPSIIKGFAGVSDSTSNGPHSPPLSGNDLLKSVKILNKGNEVLNWITRLEDLVTKDQKIDMKLVINQKTGDLNTDWAKGQLVKLKSEFEQEEDSQPKQRAMELINQAISVYSEFDNLNNNPEDEKMMSKIISQINPVCNKARKFSTYCAAANNSSGLNVQPPQMAKADSEESTGRVGAGTAAVRNARFKIQQTTSMFQKSQESYEKSFQNLMRSNKELAEILAGMRRCELKEIDFETTIQILMKGLDALGKVKEQWAKMICFFQMLCNLIKLCLESVKNFVSYTETASELPLYSMASFMKDMIYTEAFQATNIINMVHMISDSYVEISSEFLMDRVSSLGRLIALDPTKDGNKFDVERNKLHSDCDKASKGIQELIIRNKEEYSRNLESRVKTINENLEAVLPPVSVEEKKMIEYTVNQGMDEATKDMSDDIDI
ncbi:uncharacterized protein LOC121848591 [Callorhinchus milii]|uniref:uncharacterized protein LOC121848591 n=1 Tax=Callorhinchus milii TaxID=7868 RepID=UPI001C3F57B8|nr:uncharacterized protein LOC121848591 [Callorhinchus milii]